MNTREQVLARLRAAQQRRAATVAALAAPLLLALAALAWRYAGLPLGLAAIVLGGAALVLGARRAGQRLGTDWLTRQLDQRRGDLEDSSDLLFAAPEALGPLQALQRSRLEQRLRDAPAPDLRAPWPRTPLAVAWLAGLALAAAVLWLPRLTPAPSAVPRDSTGAATLAAKSTRILGASLEIAPPAYTGLAKRNENSLDAKLPQGSLLRWSLRLSTQPRAVALQLHDGRRVELGRDGDTWTGQLALDKSTLYRLVIEGVPMLAEDKLYRLDVIADRPPQVRVIDPERPLSLLEDGQRSWSLAFEASDDHGLGAAELRITLAQGSGENISVSERSLALSGEGERRNRRYLRRLDLAALGFAAGDDLIVRLAVSDNRMPKAQTTRSASFILRWPPEVGAEATGMEGLVKRVLPAYFRSQRQIIIDTEALLAQRRKLAGEAFVERSDLIGVDQRILRLRYGQFLGEEANEEPSAAGGDDDHADEPGGHAPPASPAAASSVLEQFGHTHDEAEAATLLDPETRALLKSALDNMWRAEEQLRTGQPAKALPFEYKALDFIKRVQQASRIYLARVGLELPPIDEGRRLSGDVAGLRGRGDFLSAATPADAAAASLWSKLDSDAVTLADLDAFEGWLREREEKLGDALGLLAAVDALRRAPDCADCERDLRALLWPLLPVPPAAPAPRRAPDAAGQAYLDAMQAERSP